MVLPFYWLVRDDRVVGMGLEIVVDLELDHLAPKECQVLMRTPCW